MKTNFLWMHAWDLEGWEPHEFLDHIVAAGLDEIRLALAYHGGRVLLPRNRRHLVYEQHESAVYFEPERGHYGRLQPAQGPHAAVVNAFLHAAASRNFPVRAWVVLTHNDWMGRQHPDCCIRNYRNEAYSYALCPAQPDVQEYILALIRDVSRLPGIVGLDLEALSFMGYDHYSLHDKRAVEIDPRLNVCHCSVCGGRGERVAVIAHLLDQIGRATKLPLDLRYTDDENFFGGKSHLPLHLLPGRVASITRTWFGKAAQQMVVPSNDPVPSNTGFQFHPPDTKSLNELAERHSRSAGSHGVGFHCYGLASEEHWSWLTRALRASGVHPRSATKV